jgi:cytochrome b561
LTKAGFYVYYIIIPLRGIIISIVNGGVKTMKVTVEAATKFKEILAEQESSADTMLRVSFGGFG